MNFLKSQVQRQQEIETVHRNAQRTDRPGLDFDRKQSPQKT